MFFFSNFRDLSIFVRSNHLIYFLKGLVKFKEKEKNRAEKIYVGHGLPSPLYPKSGWLVLLKTTTAAVAAMPLGPNLLLTSSCSSRRATIKRFLCRFASQTFFFSPIFIIIFFHSTLPGCHGMTYLNISLSVR